MRKSKTEYLGPTIMRVVPNDDRLDIVARYTLGGAMPRTVEFSRDVESFPVESATAELLTWERIFAALRELPGAVAHARELASEQGGELYEFCFSLRLSIPYDKISGRVEESAFLEQATEYFWLDELLQDYIDATLDHRGRRLWMNEEVPSGSPAARALALRNRGHLATYEAFLRTNDMNHEVYQHEDLQALVERWGWCEALYPLVAARALTLGGQHGDEQLSMWIEEEGLGEHLAEEEARRAFIDALRIECGLWCTMWPAYYGPQVDAAERRARLGSDLGVLADLLTEAELGTLI